MQIRLFVAVDLPEDVQDDVSRMALGVPGARWLDPEDYHLTLRFVGEVDGLRYQDVDQALQEVRRDPFELQLSGVGFFPPRGITRSLWVGVAASPELITLRGAVERTLTRAGLEPERRKFSPHITVARLDGTPPGRVARFITANSLYRSRPFSVDGIHLYSSNLHRKGAHYELEQSYPLGAVPEEEDDWPRPPTVVDDY